VRSQAVSRFDPNLNRSLTSILSRAFLARRDDDHLSIIASHILSVYLCAAAACRSAEITTEVLHSVPSQYRETVPSFANKIVFIE